MNSQVFPHCTAAESSKSFYLLGPLRRTNSEPVWVVHPCLWTLLVLALVTSFSLSFFCCNDQLILYSYEPVDICFSFCEILEQTNFSVVVSLEHFEFNIQVVGVNFWTKKINQIWLDIFQIPQNRSNITWLRKQ